MNIQDKRVDYIDVAKAIGIICVVAFHAQILANVSTQFHMPLFAFLSGLLFNSRYYGNGKNVFLWAKKKVKGIYIPFIKYNLLFLFFHNFFWKFNILSIANNSKQLTLRESVSQGVKILALGAGESLVGPLWYLIAMLEFTIIYCLIRYLSAFLFEDVRKQKVFVTIVCVFAMGIGFSRIDLPRNLNLAMILMMYYHLGYEIGINKMIKITEICASKWLIDFITVLILIIGAYNSVSWDTFHVITVLSSLCGIWLVFRCAMKLSEGKKGKIYLYFSYIGKNSMEILALHLIAYKVVMKIQILVDGLEPTLLGAFPIIPQSNIFWKILLVLSGINIPLLYVLIKNKIIYLYKKRLK